MIVDSKKIISDTRNLFLNSNIQQSKFSLLTDFVFEKDYRELHPKPLTPTSIKIDCDLFLKEVVQYENYFEQWGKHHSHLPRYGLALVNIDGLLKHNDPINGSLYEYNAHNQDNMIIESDCRIPTEVLNLPSLKPLSVFNGYWARSNILKWGHNAEFVPHIDNIVPAPWIRLWATINDNITVDFYDNDGKQIKIGTIEPGRLYIVDTALVHTARNLSTEYNYQLFLSVMPNAHRVLKNIL